MTNLYIFIGRIMQTRKLAFSSRSSLFPQINRFYARKAEEACRAHEFFPLSSPICFNSTNSHRLSHFPPPLFAGLPPPLVLDRSLSAPDPVSPAEPCAPPSCCPRGLLMSGFAGLTFKGLFASYPQHHQSARPISSRSREHQGHRFRHLRHPAAHSPRRAAPPGSSCWG